MVEAWGDSILILVLYFVLTYSFILPLVLPFELRLAFIFELVLAFVLVVTLSVSHA